MLCIDTNEVLGFETSTFIGRSVAVLGITDSGKTNTVAVLIEELLGQLPMTIVDIEGEYWGLKERFDLLIAGRSEHAELEIGPENAAALAEISLSRGISIILDLSDYSAEEQHAFLQAYFTRLWEVAGNLRKPYQIVLEEAHEFIPQGASSPLKSVLTRIALRGRKRGLGIILASQRSAKVEKDVLTQVPLLFLHRVVHPIDVKVYKDLVPLPPARVEEIVGGLAQGQAIVLYQHTAQVAQIRRRATFHAGATPTLDAEAAPHLRAIDAATLAELRAMLEKEESEADVESSPLSLRREQRVSELETALAAKDQEIAQLREQIATQKGLIETMQTRLANSDQRQASPASAGGTIPEVVQQALAPQRTAARAVQSPPFNERKFSALQRRLRNLSSMEYRLLQVLHEQGRWLGVREIAAWLQVQESTFSKSPPSTLLGLGLVERTGSPFQYRSRLHDYLSEEYPGLDVNALVSRLFE